MNKEEVLEQIKKENKNVDLQEQLVLARGGNIGYSVGIVLASVFFAISTIWKSKPDFSCMALWMAMEAAMFIYKYIKLRRAHELIFAILFTLFAIAFTVIYMFSLAGVFGWQS